MSDLPATAQQEKKIPLGLPAPSDDTNNGTHTIKLDHLGPMIVNSDGTISRIHNWQNMSDIEKDRSLRLLSKRNNIRMENLKRNGTPQSPDSTSQ